MRTTFALAALAASTAAIDFSGVEQLTAGLIDGMIGKNDLPEIQKCMTDSDTLASDIQTTIDDIEQGSITSIIAGIQEGIKVSQEIPTALSDCQNIQDDVSAVEAYFSQFTDIKKTSEIIFKNVLSNFSGVSKDVSTLDSDYSSQEYFQAGQDLAQLFVDTLGPIQGKSFSNIKTTVGDAEEFVAGFIQGLVGHNDLPAIQECMTDETTVVSEVTQVIDDVQKGTILAEIDAAKVLLKLTKDLPNALSDCKSMSSDIDEIKQWASQFTDAATTAKILIQNAAKNYQEIMTTGSDLVTQAQAGDFQQAGVDSAIILTDMLGEITPQTFEDHQRLAIAGEFLIGFLTEMIQLENLTNLENCMVDVTSLAVELQLAIGYFKKKDISDILQGITMIGTIASQLPTYVGQCEQVQEGLPKLKQWAELFKHPMDLASIVAQNFYLHYEEMMAAGQDLVKQWDAKEYINVGYDSADLLDLAVGDAVGIKFTPFESVTEYMQVAEGMIYGLIKDENLTNLDTCMTDFQTTESLIRMAIQYLEEKTVEGAKEAVLELGLALHQIPDTIADCKNVSQDIDQIKQIVSEFDIATISKNVALHPIEIARDTEQVTDYMNNSQYFEAGEEIADIISIALGTQ